MARSDSTSSRMSRRNSRERRNWSRSEVRTGSPPDRSVCWFAFAGEAATRTGTYQVVTAKSRGFLGGRGPAAQAAGGEEGVEDELGGTGQGAEVAERGRHHRRPAPPPQPHHPRHLPCPPG